MDWHAVVNQMLNPTSRLIETFRSNRQRVQNCRGCYEIAVFTKPGITPLVQQPPSRKTRIFSTTFSLTMDLYARPTTSLEQIDDAKHDREMVLRVLWRAMIPEL